MVAGVTWPPLQTPMSKSDSVVDARSAATDLRGEGPEWVAILSCQAHVTDLELALIAVQQIGGLEVSVQHPGVVKVRHTLKQLMHQTFHLQDTQMAKVSSSHDRAVAETMDLCKADQRPERMPGTRPTCFKCQPSC